MLSQGVLDFQYESERANHGQTALAGLPLYLDLIRQSGLAMFRNAAQCESLGQRPRKRHYRMWKP